MASDSESAPSTPDIKKEDIDLQPVTTSGRKKAKATKKKRNLVRWDDDLDKQVLLTLQWACNEVGIKIPWELVAQTLGRGISEGAIVQHLSKLRGKMIVAKIEVPPTLKRGTINKEPSKLYASSNGKKLPPPIFKQSPSTPVQAKAKKEVTPKASPKVKSSAKLKSKRRRSDLDDSDEEEIFNEINGESDEEYGTAKKKARTSKPKAKEVKVSSNKSMVSKPKTVPKELVGSDADDINQDIMAALEEDGGPATRTRHVKQDFTNLEPNFTDEEEDEGEDFDEAGFGELDMLAVYSPATLKREDSSTPSKAAPMTKIDVAHWNQDVVPSMLPLSGGALAKDYEVVPPHQQANMFNNTGLMTPQLSRQASTTSYNTSIPYTPLQTGFNPAIGRGFSQDDFAGTQVVDPRGLFSTVNYNGGNNYLPTFNSGLDLGNGDFNVDGPYAPVDLGDGYDYGLGGDTIFDKYTMYDKV